LRRQLDDERTPENRAKASTENNGVGMMRFDDVRIVTRKIEKGDAPILVVSHPCAFGV